MNCSRKSRKWIKRIKIPIRLRRNIWSRNRSLLMRNSMKGKRD